MKTKWYKSKKFVGAVVTAVCIALGGGGYAVVFTNVACEVVECTEE